jgi:hypothetical protein
MEINRIKNSVKSLTEKLTSAEHQIGELLARVGKLETEVADIARAASVVANENMMGAVHAAMDGLRGELKGWITEEIKKSAVQPAMPDASPAAAILLAAPEVAPEVEVVEPAPEVASEVVEGGELPSVPEGTEEL